MTTISTHAPSGAVISELGSQNVRRSMVRGGMVALCSMPLTLPASAALPSSKEPSDEWQDRVAITDLIMRERWARETRNPDVAAHCFHPDAWVEVSWFKGSAHDFVEQSRRSSVAASASVNFDSLSPPVIWLKGERAIADAACALHTVLKLQGVEVLVVSYTRLLWRLKKVQGAWLILSLQGMYIRDQLQATSPNLRVQLDEQRLQGYRPAYRHLSYVLAEAGRPPRSDLPGLDRPETVAALHEAEQQWLDKGI